MAMPDKLVKITYFTDKETMEELGRISTVQLGEGLFETMVTGKADEGIPDAYIEYPTREQARGGHHAILSLIRWGFPDAVDEHHLLGPDNV